MPLNLHPFIASDYLGLPVTRVKLSDMYEDLGVGLPNMCMYEDLGVRLSDMYEDLGLRLSNMNENLGLSQTCMEVKFFGLYLNVLDCLIDE